MAVTSFIPKLWSARLLNALDKHHVATNLVNRDYEGMIKQRGDTVHINTIGAVTIRDYTKNSDINAPDALTTSDQTLVIDQQKYYNFQIDDVDAAQASGDIMDKAMTRAAYGLADEADSFLLTTMAEGADPENVIDMLEVAIAPTTVYSKIIELRTKLDKANVPTEGRSIVIPPDVYAMLLQDDRFAKAGDGAITGAALLRGEVGSVAGFKVFESNNTPFSASKYSIIASVPLATTYAEQVVKTEAYRMEKRFSDAVKGLHVYGAKVTNGKAIAVLKCKIA